MMFLNIKRIVSILLICIILLSVGATATYIFVKPDYDTYIDNNKVDGVYSYKGNSYIKVREFEKYGIVAKWDNAKRRADFYIKITPPTEITTSPIVTVSQSIKPSPSLSLSTKPSTSISIKPSPSPSVKPSISTVVYITKTGAKYHQSGCSYLKNSSIKISLEDAKKQGYMPCSRCCK
jgi:hypothetical protein